MKSISIILALSGLLCWQSCSVPRSPSAPAGAYRIAFYNVENLFDTEDDPFKQDEDFTPGGRLAWTTERYHTKLEHLAKVVEGLGFPALLGLAEVENAAVLKDFCEKTTLKNRDYAFVHYDSPDERGIDVALLYQTKVFSVLHSEAIRIDFPAEVAAGDPDPATRDILLVSGIFYKKDTLHLLVAHFPSRSGGVEKTEPMRIFVARQMRSKVEELFGRNPAANVLLLGDFNDEPSNRSIAEILAAKPFSDNPVPATLYNCFSDLHSQGKGTYNFRGNWNMLDQIILSGKLLNNNPRLRFRQAGIFRQHWMMYKDVKYGESPNRTYGGPNYYGGYSDHLPVWISLR